MKFTAIKKDWYLIPQGDEGINAHEKIPEGAEVYIEYIKSRSPGNHRRAFAFFNMVFDMQEHFTDMNPMRKWLTMKAGYYTEIVAPNGKIVFIPKSIAFDKITDEDEFRALFSKIIDVVIREKVFNVDDNNSFNRVLEFV